MSEDDKSKHIPTDFEASLQNTKVEGKFLKATRERRRLPMRGIHRQWNLTVLRENTVKLELRILHTGAVWSQTQEGEGMVNSEAVGTGEWTNPELAPTSSQGHGQL